MIRTGKKIRQEKLLAGIRERFGKKPEETRTSLDDIRIYYEETKQEASGRAIDDVTWNDLEMDRVFMRLNNTKTYLGEQVLYQQLHRLEKERKEQENQEKRLQYLKKHDEVRENLELQLQKIGKNREDYYLPMFLYNAADLEVKHYMFYRVLQVLLFANILLALLWGALFGSEIFVLPLVCIALLNLFIYVVNKDRYEIYLSALLSVKNILLFTKMISTKKEFEEIVVPIQVQEAMNELDKLTRMIGNFQMKKAAAFSGDMMAVVRDYLIGMTLWDFTIYRKITGIIAGKLEDVMVIFDFVGQIDMDIAVTSFRESVPFYCEPKYMDTCALQMEEVYHPLLDEPVSNDLELTGGCIITGSNASGKSTFIKAVAINAILAQNIHTCMAKQFAMPPMQVVTSMTVRDDILEGESYYIRELHYLKRVVEEVNKGRITLCIIDEILRGTNTQERLAASEAILTYIAERDCIVIAATHDMELAESMHDRYRCLHFCNYIQEGNIVFDFKIHEGKNETTNALKLLEYIGFPNEIVAMAQNNFR